MKQYSAPLVIIGLGTATVGYGIIKWGEAKSRTWKEPERASFQLAPEQIAIIGATMMGAGFTAAIAGLILGTGRTYGEIKLTP